MGNQNEHLNLLSGKAALKFRGFAGDQQMRIAHAMRSIVTNSFFMT
jgi:hypothetical protein